MLLLDQLFRGLLAVTARSACATRSEALAASSPPPPLRLLPGGANRFPGWNFNPRWTSALHGTPTRISWLGQRCSTPGVTNYRDRCEAFLLCGLCSPSSARGGFPPRLFMSLSQALKSARSLRAVEDLFCQQIAPILMPLGDPSAYARTHWPHKRTKNGSKSRDCS